MRMLCAVIVGLWAGAAGAADLALIVGNEDYRRLPDVRAAGDVLEAQDALERRGFRVIAVRNGTGADLGAALSAFVAAAPDADRVAVILTGHFLQSAGDAWLVPADAPETPALATLSRTGIPLSVVTTVLDGHPGKAVLALGHGGRSGRAGPFLSHGVTPPDLPQGVTGITGDASSVAWFVQTALTRPGLRLADAAGRLAGIATFGFLPADYVFLPGGATAEPAPVPLPDRDPETEAQFWQATRQADTVAAYEAYLRRYPDGPHAAEAKRYLTEIRTEPNRPARLAEDALGLTRDERREIQRALSILDHNPRGIDGIFGPGSRAAIGEWQRVNGYPASTYVTREQIAALAQQADVRAAELEREAEVRRLEQERQDRAYWEATGAVGDEAGLRAYLGRYPDGIFAELAQSRLDAIEEANRAKAAAQDRAAWDAAVAAGSVTGYRLYLQEFPKGAFAEEATARIAELTAEAEMSDELKRAAAREEALGLNRQTRLVVEQRLEALDLRPGEVDGEFDERSRRAIRRYQQQREIRPTGYLDELTVVRIMADAILR